MKKNTCLALALALMLGSAGCSRKESDGNLLVQHESYADDIKSLDPANAYDTNSLDIVPSIYETLYQYAYLADTYQLQPLLAADMPKYSADRLTITIPIRNGVRFQDDPCFKETQGKGRELKAQDFVYALKRLALPSLQSQGWWILDGKIKGVNAFHDKLLNTPKEELAKSFAEPIEGIQALDDRTLQLKLLKPYPQLLSILAMSFTAPVAREAVETYGDPDGNLTEHPVGTGPFVLKKWDRNRQIVLERNPNFHPDFYPTEGAPEFRKKGLLTDAGKPLPFLDRVVIRIIHEQQPRWLAFMKGEQDRITIPKDNFSQAVPDGKELAPEFAQRGIRLGIDSGTTFYYVSFNMKDKLLGSNKYLRQALASAIDRDKYIAIFTNGTGRKMVNALPPGLVDRPKNASMRYDYDVKRAQALLRKAGYPEGQGLPTLTFDLRGADSVSRQMGEFFTQQFAAIGVKLNVIPNTFPAFLEKAKQGNLQISFGGWGLDYPDAENVYQLFYGPNKSPGPNESNFDHPAMNKLYETLATMEAGPKRAAVIEKIEELVQEEVPWAYLYYLSRYDLSHPWLLNYRPNDLILNRFKYYRVNKDIKIRYLGEKR
ncbi:MAG: ABC transporter substrate-binding protein [Oligoflexia bacterium]|nr:ABC transporter substrate-binding protein [Oligoflexia bacterium]